MPDLHNFVQVLQDLFYVLLQLLVVDAISFNFYCKFYCMFYFTCDRSFKDPPDNWRRKIGRPRQSWFRTEEADLPPMNLVLATAKRHAHGPISLTETRDNGYIDSDTLLKKNLTEDRQHQHAARRRFALWSILHNYFS